MHHHAPCTYRMHKTSKHKANSTINKKDILQYTNDIYINQHPRPINPISSINRRRIRILSQTIPQIPFNNTRPRPPNLSPKYPQRPYQYTPLQPLFHNSMDPPHHIYTNLSHSCILFLMDLFTTSHSHLHHHPIYFKEFSKSPIIMYICKSHNVIAKVKCRFAKVWVLCFDCEGGGISWLEV
jgi:hypothetical protein